MRRLYWTGGLWLIAISLSSSTATQALQEARRSEPYYLRIPLGLIEPHVPKDSPLTVSVVSLGRQLFFDTRLSATGRTSCASCHSPSHGFAEPRSVSHSDSGAAQQRNAPSVLNAGFLTSVGWDGRFKTLEDQAAQPFDPEGDMGIDFGEALRRIAADQAYVQLFQEAFGSGVTAQNFKRAVASFQRSLVSGDTPFDRYLFGNDKAALSGEARAGLNVFLEKGNCINCHDVFHPAVNPLGGRIAELTDHRFHNLGVGFKSGRMADTGRYMATADPQDWGAFKTPSLRNVGLTAPYMHDGSLRTLVEVVDFYNAGGIPNRNLSVTMRPLYLSGAERFALVRFLEALTDPALKTASPAKK